METGRQQARSTRSYQNSCCEKRASFGINNIRFNLFANESLQNDQVIFVMSHYKICINVCAIGLDFEQLQQCHCSYLV